MGDKLLRSSDVRERYDCSDMAIWRRMRHPTRPFPAPDKIGGQNYWKASDLDAWDRMQAEAQKN